MAQWNFRPLHFVYFPPYFLKTYLPPGYIRPTLNRQEGTRAVTEIAGGGLKCRLTDSLFPGSFPVAEIKTGSLWNRTRRVTRRAQVNGHLTPCDWEGGASTFSDCQRRTCRRM